MLSDARVQLYLLGADNVYLLYLLAPEEVVVNVSGQLQEVFGGVLLRDVSRGHAQLDVEAGGGHRQARAREVVVLALRADDVQYRLLRHDLYAEAARRVVVAGGTFDVRLLEHQLLYLLQVDVADLHALRRYLVLCQDGADVVGRDEAIGDAVDDFHAHALARPVLSLAAKLPDGHHEVSHNCQKQKDLECCLHDRGRSMSVIC